MPEETHNCQWQWYPPGVLRCPNCDGPEYPSGMAAKRGPVSADSTLWPRRQCKGKRERRSDDEKRALVAVCHTCPNFGDKRPGYEFAAVCQLDAPSSDNEPCRKKAMVAAYLRRVDFRGGECTPWVLRLRAQKRLEGGYGHGG
jgi:hypothetical protein